MGVRLDLSLGRRRCSCRPFPACSTLKQSAAHRPQLTERPGVEAPSSWALCPRIRSLPPAWPCGFFSGGWERFNHSAPATPSSPMVLHTKPLMEVERDLRSGVLEVRWTPGSRRTSPSLVICLSQTSKREIYAL